MLLLDGVYAGDHAPRFQQVKAPERAELEQLVSTISERTGRYLERRNDVCANNRGPNNTDKGSGYNFLYLNIASVPFCLGRPLED